MGIGTTDERTGVLLQHERGRWFCAECLALLVGVSLQAMEEAMTILEGLPGYRVSDGRCSVCERLKHVIRAVADRPQRR